MFCIQGLLLSYLGASAKKFLPQLQPAAIHTKLFRRKIQFAVISAQLQPGQPGITFRPTHEPCLLSLIDLAASGQQTWTTAAGLTIHFKDWSLNQVPTAG